GPRGRRCGDGAPNRAGGPKAPRGQDSRLARHLAHALAGGRARADRAARRARHIVGLEEDPLRRGGRGARQQGGRRPPLGRDGARRSRGARAGARGARRIARVLRAPAVLVPGGWLRQPTDSTAPMDILSPGKWVPLASMPTARQEVAVAQLNGRVFVVGGFGPDNDPVATVEVYDPAVDRWETRGALPAPTHHAAAAVVAGRLFVVGGFSGGRVSWTPLRTVYEYDDARSSWATPAPLRQARGGRPGGAPP